MTIGDKFETIFNSGYCFVFQNTAKHIDGDWDIRIIWEHKQEPGNRCIRSCKWEGFTNINDCLDDCLEYVKTLK